MTIYGKAGSEHYRTTGMHNTIAVDGKSQALGPGAKCAVWETMPDHDFIDASHELYKNLRHRRRAIFVKPDYYVLIDDVTGSGNRQLDWNYHFLTGAKPAIDDGIIRTNFPKGGNLAILPIGDVHFDRNKPKPFKYVHGGGEVESTGWLLRTKTSLPQRLITLLVPFKGKKAPKLQAEIVADNVIKVHYGDKNDLIAWRPDGKESPWILPLEGGDQRLEQAATVIRSAP